jgi:PAS domain S-box-containing protein
VSPSHADLVSTSEGGSSPPGSRAGSEKAPRTFRRDSRLFLSIALLLVLFLNSVTLLLFRASVDWGSQQTERRAAEILRRLSLSSGEPADSLERVALEPDVLFAALYDLEGRKLHGIERVMEPPTSLPIERPQPGRLRSEWRTKPDVLLAALSGPKGIFAVALDAGAGAALRSDARIASIVIPLASAVFVVLAWLYLRSLLAPYERLLETAESAPAGALSSPHQDERDFLIARFKATIDALSEKERELARLARIEKERADDLEIAARTLARNLPTGLLSVDRDGIVVELNEAGREILDVKREVKGEPYENLLKDAPEFRAVVAAALDLREAVARKEIRWDHSGREQRVVGVTVTPASGADGRFLGVLALFSDLSEVKRLEARVALARHLADLGEVSAGAAHEFRNSAAAIGGFADLALRHPDRAAEHLQAIRREAQQMSQVTSDFLLFARPQEFVPQRVSLSSITEEAVAETEMAFPEISISCSGDLPEISGSPVLLRRAVSNLLRNAVEATPRPRRLEADAITLTGVSHGQEAMLRIGDRGPGVEPSEREKIFLPFFSTKPAGAGFGLAIVTRIAELHGGTVEVASRAGGGSVFTLRLASGGPAAATRGPDSAPSSADDPRRKPPTSS